MSVLQSPSRGAEQALAWFFWGLFGVMLLLLTRDPADRVHLDAEGPYVEERDWWGLSRTNRPLRQIDGDWYVRHGGEWLPFSSDFIETSGPTRPGSSRP